MNYVTDTHALVWHFIDDPRLGEKAKVAFEQTLREGEIIIPAVVLAEIIYPDLFINLGYGVNWGREWVV